MDVHAGAVLVAQGLGHEGGVDVVLERDLLDGEAVGHRVVGHREGVGVAEVDLVLRRRDLVVRGLDGDAEVFEGEDGLAAEVGAGVERREVEVAADVEDLRRLGVREVEVLELRADVEGVLEVGRRA